MTIEIKVPALGESVTEATVGQWFKKPGEAVNADEPLVELETDKVSVEVPAPAAGVLADIRSRKARRSRVGACWAPSRKAPALAAQPAAKAPDGRSPPAAAPKPAAPAAPTAPRQSATCRRLPPPAR